MITNTSPVTTTIPSNAPLSTTDFIVPAIEGLESHIQRFARERNLEEVPPFAWQKLSPLDSNKFAEQLCPYSGYEPLLPGTTAFLGRDGNPAGVLVRVPNGIGIHKILETYEDAIRYFKIVYRLVTVPPKATPGLLFLAPGETGEVVNDIPDPNLPF